MPAPAGAPAPLPPVVVLATGAVTVKFTGLLSWPPADSVSETAFGSPAQSAPVEGSPRGTVNWTEAADQVVPSTGSPFSSNWRSAEESRLAPRSVTGVPGGPVSGLGGYSMGVPKVTSFLPR